MSILNKIISWGILLFIFLIPWQARWIISVGEINGGPWEYGTQSVYATEILLAVILVLVILSSWSPAFLRGDRIHPSFFKWILSAARKAASRMTTPHGALLLFLIYAGLSVFWAIDKNAALIHWRWLIELGVVFVFLGRMANGTYEAVHRLQWTIILSAVIQAGWGIGQWLVQSIPASTILGMASHSADVLGAAVVETLDGRWLRAYGSFPHPNMLGGWLVLGLIILMRRCCLDPQGEAPYTGLNKYKRFLPRGYGVETTVNYALFIIILFGLLTTFSRSAWLAFGVFFIVWFIREVSSCHSGLDPEPRSKKRNWIPAFAGMTLIGLIVSIFIVLFPQPFLTRLNNNSRLEYKSTSERQASLSEGWEIIKKYPLLGAGIGNYGLAVHRQIASDRPAWSYQPSHNVFLLITAELGLVGFLLLTLNFLLFTFRLGRNHTGLTVVLGLLPLFTLAMLDHYLWSLYSGLMILALYLVLANRKKMA